MSRREGSERVETRQVRFRVLVPPTIGVVLQAPIPLNGRITEVTYHFPPGANQLVQMALRYGATRISPIVGFISLDDATPVFYVSQPCRTGEDLFLTIQNTDLLIPHTVSCVVTVVGNFRPIERDEGA